MDEFKEYQQERKIRFHDLRQTAATILLENNADMKVFKKRLRYAVFHCGTLRTRNKKVSRAVAERFDKFNHAAR